MSYMIFVKRHLTYWLTILLVRWGVIFTILSDFLKYVQSYKDGTGLGQRLALKRKSNLCQGKVYF